ncbi:mechanosensitive ion channel family protein, partial [Bacillus thuringiensis]|nr:mechanosensitive ion channel family protein [Bacillus thuringiensis]
VQMPAANMVVTTEGLQHIHGGQSLSES